MAIEDPSNLIAIGSALVAGVAALYARWAALAAQRANEISIHNERLAIYKALLHHRATLASRGSAFPEEALWPLHDAVQLAEFYFGKKEYEAMDRILKDSFEVKSLVGVWEATKSEHPEKWPAPYEKTENLDRATHDGCLEVAELLKPRLRISASK